MAAPIEVKSIFLAYVSFYILIVLLNLCESVRSQTFTPLTCTPGGYDVANLTAVDFWYFDGTNDQCVNGRKTGDTCRFSAAFCKPIPDKRITNCTNASVCQRSSNVTYKVGGYTYDPFNQLEVNGFRALFENGEQIVNDKKLKCNLSIEYYFKCDPSVPWLPVKDVQGGAKIPGTVVTKFNHDSCKYNITVQYSGACFHITPAGVVPSLSTGSVLLIVVFVTTALYLVIGSSYNFCQGQTGGAICPNSSTWFELRELIQEGCLFSWRTITCQPAVQSDITYENI